MIFGISKTTINGVLAFLIATFTTVLAFQIPSAMLSPGASHMWLWVTLVGNGVVAVLRVWVGLLQNDAPPPAVAGQTGSGQTAGSRSIGSKLPLILMALLLIPALSAWSCSGWERNAFQTLASAKATIDGAHAAYEVSASLPGGSCASVPASTTCIQHTAAAQAVITKAVQADTLAVQVMEQYEQDKATNAGATAMQAAQNDVTNALASLSTIVTEVKALYGGKP